MLRGIIIDIDVNFLDDLNDFISVYKLFILISP